MNAPHIALVALTLVSAPLLNAQNTAFPQSQGIVLDRRWETPMQGGSATMRDLGVLLSPFVRPSQDTSPDPALRIYEGVTYLMPIQAAIQALGLKDRLPSKNKVACPGFPRDSFFFYGFNGVFEGHYNRMYIVVDKADQVVSVQFVSESPKKEMVQAVQDSDAADWHTYNFVNARSKATSKLRIGHNVSYQGDRGSWITYQSRYNYTHPKGAPKLLRIDSLLMDPKSKGSFTSSEWKPLESVRWYIPAPVAELILHCVTNSVRGA